MFNLGIDGKLRGCDLVRLQVNDVCVGRQRAGSCRRGPEKDRVSLQFELTEQTRSAVEGWLDH